jgi:hypothetical protein
MSIRAKVIIPSQLFHRDHWLGLKMSLKYVIRKDLNFMRAQVMLPSLQATHYCEQLSKLVGHLN